MSATSYERRRAAEALAEAGWPLEAAALRHGSKSVAQLRSLFVEHEECTGADVDRPLTILGRAGLE